MKEIEKILYDYANISYSIQKLNRELNEIITGKNETYNTLKAAKMSGIPHGTDISNQVLDAVEKLIDRYLDRVKEITYQINKLMDLQQQVDSIMYQPDLLTIEERRIVDLRYIKQYQWYRIPSVMKYSRAQCFRIHEKALEKISQTFQNMRQNETKRVI